MAETFANEINAQLIQINQEGNITDQDWETLNNAKKALCLVRRLIWVQHHGNLKNLLMQLQRFGSHVVGKIKFLQVLRIVQV